MIDLSGFKNQQIYVKSSGPQFSENKNNDRSEAQHQCLDELYAEAMRINNEFTTYPLPVYTLPFKAELLIYKGCWVRKTIYQDLYANKICVVYDMDIWFKEPYSTRSIKPLGDSKMAGCDNFKGKKIGQSKLGGTKFRAPTKAETTGKMSAGKKKK